MIKLNKREEGKRMRMCSRTEQREEGEKGENVF